MTYFLHNDTGVYSLYGYNYILVLKRHINNSTHHLLGPAHQASLASEARMRLGGVKGLLP